MIRSLVIRDYYILQWLNKIIFLLGYTSITIAIIMDSFRWCVFVDM